MPRLHWPYRWGLGTRLTLAMLGLLLVVQVIVVASYRGNVEERRTAEIENAVVIGQTAAAVVDGFVRDLEGMTLATALALGAWETPLDQATAGPFLDALYTQYGVLRALFLTDLDGRVVAAGLGTGVGTDLATRPYIVALQAGAETVWSDGLIGVQSGEITLAFGRVVRAPDGAPRAYLVAAFYPQQLLERLPATLPPDADVTLLDRRGFVLHSSQRPDLQLGQRDAADAPVVRTALGGTLVRLAAAATPLGDEARFGALVPVGRTGWLVGFTRPQAALEAAVQQRFLQQATAITAVMLLVAGLMAVIAGRLIRPLRLLAGTAAAIARGERPSVPAVAAGAEVRQLAIAMQVMSRAVAEREAHLREETATLETINRLGQLLAAELDLPRLVQAVTDAATELAGARFGAFFYSVVDERGETRTLHTLSGVSRDAFAGFPMPRNTAIFGPTFRGESVIRLQDVRQDLRYGQNAPHGGLPSGHLPVASYLAVPVVARSGDVLGGLFFGHPQPGVFTERSERIVVGLAAQAAVAMDNARLYQQAQDAIRLRDEFLSVASHELKTPLTVLRGFAQLALRQLQQKRLDPDRIGRVLERFDEQTRKLDQLVTQLLDVSRLEAGKLTLERADTDVTALVEGVIEATQASTSRHTILLRAPAEGVLQAMVDGLRLEQVVLNLLSNAVKFSPDGGRIEVELTCVSNVASGPSDRADELDGDVLRLTVRDYGVGVAPEHRARIFERFYQASAEGQPAGRGRTGSMGLGLFICRQIVELHGGHIGAEFPADGGTRFVVTLPRSTGAHAGA